MIGDTFVFNGVTYTIKKELKFGEYRKISQTNARLSRLANKLGETDNISELPEDQIKEITNEFSNASESQLQTISDFLGDYLGLTQEEVDNFTLQDAIQVFQEAFRRSTTPDKTIKKT